MEVSTNDLQSLLEKLVSGKSLVNEEVLPSLFESPADVFAPSICQLLNQSQYTSSIPSGFKEANVVPLIKLSKLDTANPSLYRGISLLLILSKVLESAVHKQLTDYFDSELTVSNCQFGFCQGHFTEDLMV